MATHITRLDNGYFQEDSWNNCTLIATLNYFQAHQGILKEKANTIVGRWATLVKNDSERNFTHPKTIPQIIEYLTDKEYFGRIVGMNAKSYLRERGIQNPEKYAVEALDRPLEFPLIQVYLKSEDLMHAVVALERISSNEHRIVDNGRVEVTQAAPGTYFQYLVEPSTCFQAQPTTERTPTPLESTFLRQCKSIV